ncbi:unnamed protein product [Urochloa humidicola]
MSAAAVPPPPSDLHRHLGDLLVRQHGADVTFQVAGEAFCAHRYILAARSPVFKAELYGAMRESTSGVGVCIRIDDMAARVFEALLHFIYTDSLPEMEGQENVPMAQHLQEAADRYGVQRLKLICEEKLSACLDTNMVATTIWCWLNNTAATFSKRLAGIEFIKKSQALDAVMATDGFEHLIKSCPALLRELISRFASD